MYRNRTLTRRVRLSGAGRAGVFVVFTPTDTPLLGDFNAFRSVQSVSYESPQGGMQARCTAR
jgi:hypothetical protein